LKSKIQKSLPILLVLMMLLASCGGSSEDSTTETPEASTDETTEDVAPNTTAAAAEPEFTFTIVYPGPLGDKSFADSAHRGVERAIAELGVKGIEIETQSIAEHETALRGAVAGNPNMVLPLALDAQLTIDIANENPNILFGAPSDVFADTLPENMAAFTINVHESSFLAGLIAGSLTSTKIVGAAVGGEAPSLNQFFYGYKQGVLEVCSDCQVLVTYMGFNFNDPALGLETALDQYERGADIVYQVAGRTGEGVLQAAAQTGNYAIGVDSNQDWVQPGSVIVSMIKRVDVTTYKLIESAKNGTFQGGFFELGMEDGAAGISWDEGSTYFEDNGPADMVAKIPAIKDLVEQYRTDILDGTYVVCDALADANLETDVCSALKES